MAESLTKRDMELIQKTQREKRVTLVLDTVDSDWLKELRKKKGK
jgi:hypothetical protein